ncbi:MAG: glycoside hydrolase family 18 protein [Dysgonomonas sp.]
MKSPFGKFTLLLTIALATTLLSCNETKKTVDDATGPAIIAYIDGSSSLDASKIAANKITHVNYAFADIKDGKASLANKPTDTENIKKLNSLKTDNPKLKVLISVAARDWSKGFAKNPLTDDASQAFAESVIEIVRGNDLDGIDINWGYPIAANLKDIVSTEGTSQNYVKVISAIKDGLNALEKETGKTYLLSCAAEAEADYIPNMGMKEAQQNLDFINVMAYNNQDAKVAIHQAGLYASNKYNIRKAASVAIEDYINIGVSSEKLVMGIPFYGNVYKVKKNSSAGIGDPVVEKIGTKGYTSIKDSLINQNEYFRYWDNEAQAPYVYNFYKSELVTYDDEESVKAKCEYVNDNNLGGIMFWEYGSDPKGFLLGAINQVLK